MKYLTDEFREILESCFEKNKYIKHIDISFFRSGIVILSPILKQKKNGKR